MEDYKNLIWWMRWMGTGQTGEATYTRVADAFENLVTENAALRRHIDNLTDAQAVMVKEFTEKLEELEEVKVERSWISVKDRLPETDELVLVSASGKPLPNITYDRAVVLASYDRVEGWIIEEYPEWDTPEVTHWMPLPDPLEKEM